MFFHNFKYTFKVLLKNKTLIFWTIVWPLILGTLFNLAFSNMINSEKLTSISIGVVQNESYEQNTYLVNTLKELSNKESKTYLFDITYSENEEELNKKLEDKKIEGYIVESGESKIVVKQSGINQTIIKYVMDEIQEYEKLVKTIVTNQVAKEVQKGNIPNTEQIYQNVMGKISQNKEYMEDTSKKNMNYMMIEFYTLIAMACLYSSLLSSEAIKNYLGNINKKGARITLAPIGRMKLLLGGLLASFAVQVVSITILLLYTRFILNVDYGSRIGLVTLLSVVGSLAGIAFGMLLGSIPFKSDNTRIGISNILVMLGCFLSGMMGVTMKYVVDKNAPIVNILNPANMITDGFYSLYYYENLGRFYFNIVSLLIVIAVFVLVSYYFIRRKKYDSI